jgi:hypothetical protein
VSIAGSQDIARERGTFGVPGTLAEFRVKFWGRHTYLIPSGRQPTGASLAHLSHGGNHPTAVARGIGLRPWRPCEGRCCGKGSDTGREPYASRHLLSRDLAEKCANFFLEFTVFGFRWRTPCRLRTRAAGTKMA